MTELRLAAVDGIQTDAPDADKDPVIAALLATIEDIRANGDNAQKGIVVLQINGRCDYVQIGKISVSEAIGLLTMAAMAIDRDVRDS